MNNSSNAETTISSFENSYTELKSRSGVLTVLNWQYDSVSICHSDCYELFLFIYLFIYYAVAAEQYIKHKRQYDSGYAERIDGLDLFLLSCVTRYTGLASYPQRVTYKLCLLTYKCLHGLAPGYLSRPCVPVATVEGRPQLRSSNDHQCSSHGHFWTSRAEGLIFRVFCP